MGLLRMCVGFLTLLIAFDFRGGDRRPWEFAVVAGFSVASQLAGAAVAFVWAALSLEVYGHFQDTIEDVNVRRWVSQMALTITWALFAATVLVLGFRWQQRNFRLAALLLFGVTAVKLILVDIAGVKEIWRIAAFLGVGALMIGATYLYQRAERRLVTSTEDSGA